MSSVLFVELLCTLVPLLKQTVFVVVSSVFCNAKGYHEASLCFC